MALTINVIGSTKIDETTGLQDDDIALANVPTNVSTAFSNAGVVLANAIQVAGGGGNDVTVTPDTGFTVNGLGFVDPTNGTLDGDASGLFTLEGRQIFLYADPNNDNVVLGREGTVGGLADPSGAIVFAVYVEETTTNSQITGGKFWTALFEPLQHEPAGTDPDFTLNLDNKLKVAATQSNTFLFDDAPSGANEFMMFGNNPGGVSTTGIVVTGRAPDSNTEDNDHAGDTVSSSQAGPHATVGVNGQHLAPGNGLSFTFVNDPAEDFTVAPNPDPHLPEGLNSTEADHEGNIQFGGYTPGVTSASFTVAQVNPTNSSVTVKISAFNDQDGVAETGTGFVEGFADDVAVNITEVKVNGVVVAADLTGNTAVISGIVNGDVVTYTTSVHTRVLIENVQPTKGPGSNITLDIGGFTVLSAQAASEFAGTQLQFDDDGPSIDPSQAAVPTLTVDETTFATDASASFAGLFTSSFGADGFKDADNNDVEDADAISYKLGISAPNVASGLVDTLTNEAVTLSVNAAGTVVTGSSATGGTVFTITLNADTGNVTLDQVRAVVHDDPNDPDESNSPAQLSAANLVTLTATITDGDLDTDTATRNIGDAFKFEDDGPTITAPFDADPVAPGIQTPEQLGNAVGQTASGTFGYDIGHDSHPAAFYDATHSDFVDTNGALAGIQIGLTGTVDNAQNPGITQAVATLTAETDTSASFDFSFHYDADPITAGVQDATAGGTLVFDKAADTYTFTLTDVIDGFSFDLLHTAELVDKQPTGNTGHPLIVAEQLTPDGDPNPFFVQFTGNSTTQQIGFGFNSTGDGAPNGPPTDVSFTQGAHDMVTNVNEDWVSATQTTNGVAGDTIQKGELLTLRFFQEDILGDVDPGAPSGGTERLDPTTSASGVVVKFDGIGASEDLVVILDLKDANGNEVTRAVNVQNSDLIKGNANVPPPYNTEFTLDNNDALLIIEQNDYTVAGETYQIQGIQIMQSANGLTGDAINLNGATGANGGSSATSNLTAWDATDNDVLKIVDIGFVQKTTGTIDADLDFSFQIADADGDTTSTQHLLVGVLNA